MDNNSPESVFRRSIALFFAIFMITGAIISGLMMVSYQEEVNHNLSALKTKEEYFVSLQSNAIDNHFDSIIGDLFFLAQHNELQAYLEDSSISNAHEIALEYSSFSANKKIYDQIRLLNEVGMEVVRINFNNGKITRTPEDKLQSKLNRYYFRLTYALDHGDVYFSPFDLNMEYGQIEEPLKPVIRIGTPVFDKTGEKKGIVLLNYFGSDLLRKLIDPWVLSDGATMLLNKDGYWLHSPDERNNWGFMFADTKRSFSHLYPDVWQQIKDRENGQMLTAEGLYTYQTIYPLRKSFDPGTDTLNVFEQASSGDYGWHLVSFVPKEDIDSFSRHYLSSLFFIGAGLFLIIASGSWFIAFAVVRKRVYLKQLKAMALYDTLTGLPNRRLFHDRLEMTLQHSVRNKSMFAFFYLDLDGFKQVNDSLGHEAGDAVLKKVSSLLRQCFRTSDTIARLGGDEFGVIVGHLAEQDQAKVIATRAIEAFSRPMELEQGHVQIGVSIGISFFPSSSKDAQELVKQADKAMYDVKAHGKNCYSIYSSKLETEGG